MDEEQIIHVPYTFSATLAQLVEQLTRNEQVERSSRLGGSISAEFNRIRTFLF